MAEPVSQAYSNPDIVTTTYPSSGAPVMDLRSVSTGATAQADLAPQDTALYGYPTSIPPPTPTPSSPAVDRRVAVSETPQATLRSLYGPTPAPVPMPNAQAVSPPRPSLAAEGMARFERQLADHDFLNTPRRPDRAMAATARPIPTPSSPFGGGYAQQGPTDAPAFGGFGSVDWRQTADALRPAVNAVRSVADRQNIGSPDDRARRQAAAAEVDRRIFKMLHGPDIPAPSRVAMQEAAREADAPVNKVLAAQWPQPAPQGIPNFRRGDYLPEPGGGAIRAQEAPVPAPEASIPDRLGAWVRDTIVEPGTRLDPAVAGFVDAVHVPVPDLGGGGATRARSQGDAPLPPQPGAYSPSTNPQTPEDWTGATTRSLELWKGYSPEDWAARTKRSAVEVNGVPQKLIESTEVPGLYVGYVDANGAVVPVGNDVSSEDFLTMIVANAAEAPPGWGDAPATEAVPAPESAAATSGSAGTTGTAGATLADVSIPAPSGGGGSSRSSGGWRDYGDGYDRGYDRDYGDATSGHEFTAADFMEAANGDRRRAAMMARFANRRRRKGKGGLGGGMFGDGFPFAMPPSPIRANILASLGEAFSQVFPGRTR